MLVRKEGARNRAEVVIERRYGPRKALTVPVGLYVECRWLGRCYSIDVAMDGIFIDTGRLVLGPGRLVEIELLESGAGDRLKGIVAHGSRQGIGVTFTQPVTVFLPYLLEGADGAPGLAAGDSRGTQGPVRTAAGNGNAQPHPGPGPRALPRTAGALARRRPALDSTSTHPESSTITTKVQSRQG
jgi:hypothetical protein